MIEIIFVILIFIGFILVHKFIVWDKENTTQTGKWRVIEPKEEGLK